MPHVVGAARSLPPRLSPAGTLLNTAHLAAAGQAATYVLSASHCRGFDTGDDAALYSAVFDERQGACAWPGAAASPAQPAPAPRVLTGLRVAWQDEASDVLLLRADGAIPAGGGGWGQAAAGALAAGCWEVKGAVP